MNPPNPLEDDAGLRSALKEAHPSSSLPPRFQEGVWSRIDRAERQESARGANGLEFWLARLLRPAWISAGLAGVMLAGVWVGIRDGDSQALQEGRSRYLAVVSPMHRPAP